MVEFTGVTIGISLFTIFLVFQFFSTIANLILGLIFNRVVLYGLVAIAILYLLVPESILPYLRIILDYASAAITSLFTTSIEFINQIVDDILS